MSKYVPSKKVKEEVETFLDLLPLVQDRDWRISEQGLIRQNHTGHCPICSLASELGLNPQNSIESPTSTEYALDSYTKAVIMDCADIDPNKNIYSSGYFFFPKIRQRMIDILIEKKSF